MTTRITLTGTVHETLDTGWMDVEIDNVGRYWVPPEAATQRTLLCLSDVATLIGRPSSTVKAWVDRKVTGGRRTVRYVDPPAVAYWPASGPLWDREVVEAWMADHPDQCRGRD